jgi:hypothetical protein
MPTSMKAVMKDRDRHHDRCGIGEGDIDAADLKRDQLLDLKLFER